MALANPTLGKAPLPEESRGPTPKHKFEGHQDNISGFGFLHDNVHIVSSSRDGTIRKWNCETGLLIGEPWEAGRGIWTLALSPNGKIFACGKEDGQIQLWNTDGKMIRGISTGHSDTVRSLTWSHSGGHIASGFGDGTILFRRANKGEVDMRPIKTKQGIVCSLAYSPSGDRIASGGDKTICIWDSKTGKLLVGPIEDLRSNVDSIVWSSDSSKLYSASDEVARMFDSVSGTLLHRFEHHGHLRSLALYPTDNAILACVGGYGVARLWDTRSLQPFGQPFDQEDGKVLRTVSFSPNGRYLAYSGYDRNITLWIVKDIAPEYSAPPALTKLQGARQQGTEIESPSSSYLDVDATNPFAQYGINDITEEGDDPYEDFFRSSYDSLPSPPSDPSPKRRLWNVGLVPSSFRSPGNESTSIKERIKHSFRAHRALSESSIQALAISKPTEPKPQRTVGARDDDDEREEVDLPDCPAGILSSLADQSNDKGKGKQREEPLADAEISPPDDSSSPAKSDSNENRELWKLLRRARGKDKAPAKVTRIPSPEVVEVYAVRTVKGYVALKRKRKAKSSTLTSTLPGGSSQADTTLQSSQVAAGLTIDSNNDDSHSDSSIQGSWNKFLDKICFPRGHYHEDT